MSDDTAPAAMPSEEEVARAIYDALYHDRLSDAWTDGFDGPTGAE